MRQLIHKLLNPQFKQGIAHFFVMCALLLCTSIVQAATINAPIVTITGINIDETVRANVGDKVNFEAIPDDYMKSVKADRKFEWYEPTTGYVKSQDKSYSRWKFNYVNCILLQINFFKLFFKNFQS